MNTSIYDQERTAIMTDTSQKKEEYLDARYKHIQEILDYDGETIHHNTISNIVSYIDVVANESAIQALKELKGEAIRSFDYEMDVEEYCDEVVNMIDQKIREIGCE